MNRKDILTFLAFLLVVVVAALPTWVAAFEQPPLEYQNLPWRVRSPVSAKKGTLEIAATRCNHKKEALTYVVSRTLVNVETAERYALPHGATTIEPGCESIISLINIIPDDTPPGRYRLIGSGRAKGAVRDFDVPWYTDSFEVIP